jgi:5-methylcytosine-specific restriction enzyme subunit McrC
MISIELKEYEQISSRKRDDGNKSWTYVSNLPKELDDKDIELQEQLENESKLIIEEFDDGLRVRATSQAGIAQFSDFSISVKPRFVSPEKLAGLFEFAEVFDEDMELSDNEVQFDTSKEDNHLVTVVIAGFINRCEKIIRQGLYKSYQTQTDDLRYLRGKLIMSQQIKNDLKKKLAFNCEFDELVTDNIENQICLHILKKCYTYLNNDDLRRKCNTLIRRFSIEVTEEIEDRRKELIESDFKIVYNRLNEHYKPIHELAKIIWQETGISDLYKFRKSSINSFFIPMYQVFEKFLANLFRKYFPEFEVDTQTTKQAWKKQEEIDAELSDEEKAYNIRTDILLWSKDSETVPEYLIDAKYKPKFSSADRYELGFYIHEYGTEHGFAILPVSPEDKQNNQSPNDTLITSKKHTPPIKIHIKYIDIDYIVNLIFSQEKDSIKKTKIEKLITPLTS